ncbi:MAG: hypothetical protein EAX81_01570 [Candidatus Thorarchaeota archaeon]|nr:hypothetical protein [Candidatus Thorarchaeota archaeon]
MPDRLIVCPSCGNEVPMGQFCNFCGFSLSQAQADPTMESKSNVPRPQSDHSAMMGHIPRFTLTIDGMDSLASACLLSRAELEIIGEELDQLIEQIGATRQALQLKEADKSLLTSRASKLRRAFDDTKKRREELTSFDAKLSLEVIVRNLGNLKSKLKKLENAQSTPDPSVVKEQRSEMHVEIKALEKELKGAIKDAGRWMKAIDRLRRVLLKKRSRLDIEHKIGDISTSAYERAVAQNNRAIRILNISERILDETIQLAKER